LASQRETVTGDLKMARIEQNETQMMAANGGADTLYNLGMMYCIGRDVEINMVEAHKWLNLAALRGSKEAKSVRSEISAEMSAQEIAEAQKQARSWLQLH
jgi:TPR repeat protein